MCPLACPWAHRTLIVRRLKGLEDAIGVSVVNPHMGEDGWTYEPDRGVVADPDGGAVSAGGLSAGGPPLLGQRDGAGAVGP